MLLKHKNAEIVNQKFFKNDRTKEEYAAVAYKLDKTDLVTQFYPTLPHILTKTVNNVITKDELKKILNFIIPRTTNPILQLSVDVISPEDTHFNEDINRVDDVVNFIKDSERAINYNIFLHVLEENDECFKSQYTIKFD